MTRRRTKDHARLPTGIEFRVVAEALQHIRALVLSLNPAGDGTTRMGADGGISDDAIDRAGCGLLIELTGIKRHQQYLVEARAIPYELALRLHWPSEDRLIAA